MAALLGISTQSFAQTATADPTQTAQEEAQGKVIYDNLQTNKVSCTNLSDNDFEFLGDYYMGQMMGSSHAAMDNLMTQRMGEANNRLMHIALGKRLSGCDTSAVFPSQGVGFLPMMGMMGNLQNYNSDNNGNYNQPYNFNSMMGNYFGNSMMGFGYGYGAGWLGVILMVLFWALVIILIVMLVRGLTGQNKKSSDNNGNSAIEILKERYAKGEINKEEFKAKKKDLI